MFFQNDEPSNLSAKFNCTDQSNSGGNFDFSSFEFDTEQTNDVTIGSSTSDRSSKKKDISKLKQVVYVVEKVNSVRKIERLTMKKVDIVKQKSEQKPKQFNDEPILLSCKYNKIKGQGIIDDCDVSEIHLRNLNLKRNERNINSYGVTNLKQTIVSQNMNNEITINTPNQIVKSNFLCHDRSKIFLMKTSFDLEEKYLDTLSVNSFDSVPKSRIVWNAKEPSFDPVKNHFKFPLAGRYNRKSIGSKHNLVMENVKGQITFIVRKIRKDAFEVEVSPIIPQEIVFGLAASAIIGPKTKQ